MTTRTHDITAVFYPVAVIMDTAKNLVANFSPAATVLIRSNPSGRTVIVDGFATVTPDTFSWLLGSTHTVGTLTPQNGETATRHLWTSWSDSGAIAHSILVTGDLTLTANFQTQYYLFIGADTTNGTGTQPGNITVSSAITHAAGAGRTVS